MIRIPNDVDRYIQDGKVEIKLDQESRMVAAVVPLEKEKHSCRKNKNGVLSSDVLTDDNFSDVLSDKMQKKKTIDKKV